MPSDETTLEALAAEWEHVAQRRAAHVEREHVLDRPSSVEFWQARAAEARLIADALRSKLASITAPVAQAGQVETALCGNCGRPRRIGTFYRHDPDGDKHGIGKCGADAPRGGDEA